MQSRPASEPWGEEEEAEGHGQVPLGPRHPREDPGGGVQRGLRGAKEITPHVAPGQETLQDRDTQTGYLLHLISQSRPGCLKVPPPSPGDKSGWVIGPQAPVWQSWQLRLMRANLNAYITLPFCFTPTLQNQNIFIRKNILIFDNFYGGEKKTVPISVWGANLIVENERLQLNLGNLKWKTILKSFVKVNPIGHLRTLLDVAKPLLSQTESVSFWFEGVKLSESQQASFELLEAVTTIMIIKQ